MKSSPKLNEMPPSTGSKTPASGKKLVQARLPFKTLGGSEPPANETSDAVLATANTLTPADNRKRRQSTTTTKDDEIRAAKQRRELNGSNDDVVVVLETTEAMESDLSADSETDNGTKTMRNRNSESKENVCVDKIGADDATFTESCKQPIENVESAPNAKHSLEFDDEQPALRKSKRNESNFTIKLPVSKKSKKTKKHKKSQPAKNDNSMEEEEDKPQDTNMDVDAVEDCDVVEDANANADAEVASTSMLQDVPSDSDDQDNIGDKSLLNDSIISNASDQCATPVAKMTPKQLQRRLESEKKKQEKEQAKLERERKLQEEKEQRQREKEERELQKKREREEKEEQRKKEKEMREQKLLEEKLQKEQQRKIEREEKEEQRKREKEERELQKKKEREDKEREKEEERKKKEDEKRQKLEAEQNKNRKTSEAFVKFFVPKKVENKSEQKENVEKMDIDQAPQMFMSFQVKDDMKIAPVTRRTLNNMERSTLEHTITSGNPSVDLYLSQLKSDSFVPMKTARTWQDDDESNNADDLFIIEEDGQGIQVIKEEPKKLYRAKFFKFDENRRPPYYGTWSKRSKTVGPRKPFGLDSRLDYEVDSDDEWEEEEPGESLHGSDDEKDMESEDEYEIDNEYFVPHGHLSDEELQNEDELEDNDPENMKFKLKLAQNEFDNERKKKTQKLKPRLIGLIWQNEDGSKPDNCSNGIWDLMNSFALTFNGPSVKVERPTNQQAENSDDETANTTKPLGVRRLQIGEKEIPDLIRLINGNQNNSKFLAKEFCAYLAKNHPPQREYSLASIVTKIKELATWQACPEEGCIYRKLCWYVPIPTRQRYGVSDLTFPNNWSYTIQPRRAVGLNEVEGENKAADTNETEKKTDFADIIALSDDSNSCTLSETLTPELIKQASSKRKNYNIAKFIRPLTQDEKKKQFEPIKFNRRLSEEQMTDGDDIPSTSQVVESKNGSAPTNATNRTAKSSSNSSAPKKRLNILMSGPVGHELSPKLKSTLVTQFLSNNVRKRKSTDVNSDVTQNSSPSTAGTSDGAKKTKLANDPAVIVID